MCLFKILKNFYRCNLVEVSIPYLYKKCSCCHIYLDIFIYLFAFILYKICQNVLNWKNYTIGTKIGCLLCWCSSKKSHIFLNFDTCFIYEQCIICGTRERIIVFFCIIFWPHHASSKMFIYTRDIILAFCYNEI